jgi:NhaP-type Na+/H+ or K+/H+ antiporter
MAEQESLRKDYKPTRSCSSPSRSRMHRTKRDRLASVIPLVSATAVVLFLTLVILWHDGAFGSSTGTRGGTVRMTPHRHQGPHKNKNGGITQQDRHLAGEDPSNKITDDTKRSDTCKNYLMNFLNGTTDANDQCQAFYNAYRVADCEDETHVDILGKQKNKTTDDVVIDDFFENWECCDYIRTYYERNCDNDTGIHSAQLLGIMLVLLACAIIKALLKSWNVHWIPDACAFILVGTMVGGILRLLDSALVPKLTFDNDLFLQIMLPPIIFQAALSIDKRAVRRDLLPILAFSGLGTAFSVFAIGWVVHKVSNWGSNGTNLPLLDSLVFGSLISSIDPVATLSILSGVGVSKTDTLYTLIFGESLLNDGVAIVLFDTLKDHLGEDNALSNAAYKEMVKQFSIVLFGSMGIGLGVGMCCTLYFWALRGKQTAVTEVAIFFTWALIPYYIADGLGCSGIIAIMVMGFFMDYFVIGGFQSEESAWNDYMALRHENGLAVGPSSDRWSQVKEVLCNAFSGRGHILSRSRHHVGFVAHVIASIMDTAIFAYLGLFLFSGNVWNLRLNMTAIMGCVSSRLVMVVVLSLVINIAVFMDLENRIGKCFRALNPFRRINLAEDDDSIGSHTRVYLDRKTQLILLLSGVRGAVSFALVESIPVWDTVTKTGSQYKAELKAMTSSSIVFTLFVFGALTYIAVKHGSDPNSGDPIAGSNLTHRLLSEPLDSDDGAPFDRMDSNDITDYDRTTTPESLEIEHTVNMSHHHPMNGGGRGPHEDINNEQAQYQRPNEWTS